MENFEKLVKELCKLANETQWVEFKLNKNDPDMIGEDISALANSAAIFEKDQAYMLWGVDDKTHEIIGTKFNLFTLTQDKQELESWLRFRLSRHADFQFHNVSVDGVTVGILIINAANHLPVSFKKENYIRVGSYTKKLNDYPALHSRLLNRLNNAKFEEQASLTGVDLTTALNMLNYSLYFELKGIPQPTDIEGISHYLLEEGVIVKQDDGLYSITNMGAILLAKRLNDFPRISRKAVRVVQYKGKSRLQMLKEDVGSKGYVVGFEGLLRFIEALIPAQEMIIGALRETKIAYPILAIREAVANALIHQNFSITGTGPTVEIFDNRIEISNSGTPLVDVMRIIDNPPRSRNEKLAELMRRLRMCEELGTGWDKIVMTCELAQLPAPKIELFEDSTRVTLYSSVPFTSLSREDKHRACYLHACIQYVQGEQLTNASLRNRFGLEDSSAASVSRLIKEAVAEKIIKPVDQTTSFKYMRYVPIWA